MDISVETIEPFRAVAMRHVGPYEECGSTWRKLFVWAGKRHLVGPDSRAVGVSYDDPEQFPADRLRYDACLSIDPDFDLTDEIDTVDIGGGRYAVAMHVGSYAGIKAAFEQLRRTGIPAENLTIRSGPFLEFYYDDPEEVPEDELRTKLCIPIQ